MEARPFKVMEQPGSIGRVINCSSPPPLSTPIVIVPLGGSSSLMTPSNATRRVAKTLSATIPDSSSDKSTTTSSPSANSKNVNGRPSFSVSSFTLITVSPIEESSNTSPSSVPPTTETLILPFSLSTEVNTPSCVSGRNATTSKNPSAVSVFGRV